MVLAKTKKTADDIIKQFNSIGSTKTTIKSNNKSTSAKSNTSATSTKSDKGKQNNSSASTSTKTKKTADDIIREFNSGKSPTPIVSGKSSPSTSSQKSTTKKYTDFNSETQKAYTSAKDKVTSKTTISSNLTDKDRKKRISEINSELNTLKSKLSGYSRASAYGTSKAMTEAKKKDEARIAELSEELKTLERVGTFSASELKQFEIDDAKKKVSSARQKVNSFGQRPSLESAESYKQANSALYNARQELEQLESEQAKYKRLERLEELNAHTKKVTANKDFAQNSKYSPIKPKTDDELKAEGYKQAINGDWYKENFFGYADYYTGEDSDLYLYINDESKRQSIGADKMAQTAQASTAFGAGVPASGTDTYRELGYHVLTEEEKGAFNYLYNQDRTNGTNTAEEYLKKISPLLQERAMYMEALRYKELSKESPVVMSAISLGTNLQNAAMFPAKAAATAFGVYDDAPILDMYGNRTQAIRGGVSEDMGTVGKLAYNAGMSIGDMGVAMLAGGGNAPMIQAIMSSSAGSSTISEAKNNGASDGKALVLGLGSAAIEWATEKYSVEAILKDPKTIKGFILTNTLTEATEEGASNVSNIALDAIVSEMFGERNAIEQRIDYLVLYEGKSEEEALQIAVKEKLQSLGEDVLVGGLTGFGMSGAKASAIGVNKAVTNKKVMDNYVQDEESLEALIEEGKASGKQSAKLAEEIEKAKEKGEVTKQQIKQLIKANESFKKTAETDPIEEAAREVVNERNRTSTPITADDVKKATGFGDSGAVLITKLMKDDGVSFESAKTAVETAYRAGLTGLDSRQVKFFNDTQRLAFESGKSDKQVQDRAKQAKAQNAAVYTTGFTENEHSAKLKPAEREMFSTLAKDLKMDVRTVDKIVAYYVNGKAREANASHENGKMEVSSTSEQPMVAVALHEGFHRMRQLDPVATDALMNFLYETSDQNAKRLKVGDTGVSNFERIKEDYSNVEGMEALDYIEEIACRRSETIFSSPEAYNEWRAKLDMNPQAKSAWQKLLEVIRELLEDMWAAITNSKMSLKNKRQAQKELELFADAYRGAMKAADIRLMAVGTQTDTRSEATAEPTARENNATNKETPTKAEKQPQKEIRTKSEKLVDRMKIVLGDGEKSVGIADGQAYVTNSKDILPSRANRSVFLPVNDVEAAKVEFGAKESNKTSANISKILASDSFVPVRKNFVDGTLEGVGGIRVFTDENGREIALETNVAKYFEGYNLEATFRGGKPYAIKATDNNGNVAGVAMAVWMDTSGQKYNITDTTTGIKAGDVFVADKGIKYKILSRDAQNTTVEISSEKGSKTMVIANEVADNNFSNIPKEGITKWIDEDMHIDNRTWEDVGSRSVKAFQFLFPEMQEYYRPLAQELLWDLDNTVKGERILTGSYEMGNQEWTGVERITSDAIATIKDSTNATYDDIRNALNRLINDEGQENIALAKRIELVLDEMLTDGYNTFDGMKIPPNEEYIAKKEELIGKTYEGRPTFDEWNDDLPIFSLKAKGKNAATNSTNNLEIKINEEYNGSKAYSLKWHTDLTKAQVKEVEKWLLRRGNPEYTKITDTANWYKGRINGKDLFVIYSDKTTILYERKGVEGKAELDILLKQLEEIENGRSIVEVSDDINTLLSGDWLQEKRNLANNNAGLGGRGSNTGYASVLQGESSKFIGSQAFRSVVKNILDIQEEAEASIEKGLNGNKDYSLKAKDQEYLELAKDPEKNEARLRELVDEAAKEAGYIGTYYHGSKSDFTVFKKEFGGASNSNASIGFWFTETEEGARKWADNSWWGDNGQSKVYKTYLRLNNPKVYETVDTKAQREELKKGYENIDKEMTLYDSIYFFEDGRRYHNERYDYDKSKRRSASHTEWEAFKAIVKKYDADHIDYYLEKIPEGERQIVKQDAERYLELSKERKALENQITELRYSDAYELFRTDMYKQIGLGAEDANIGGTGKYVDNKDEMLKKYVDMIKQQGYNGIIIKGTAYDTSTFGENNNQYLVFDSNQAKSAEPVTYDDNGNIIPLSERFNTKNDDIRYSLKDSEGKTLTEAQADYFKDSKVRDAEGNLLVVYHGSPAKFTVFNHKYLNVNGNSHGRGFYFTEKRSLAEGYERKSGQLLKGYLNITNPLSEDKVTIKKSDILKLIKASCNAEAQEYVRDEEYDSVKDALRDTWISSYVNTYETSMDNAYREVANSIYSSNDNDVEMIAELTNAGRSDIVLRLTYDILGYDGVIYTAEDGTHEFVSLVSEQFKSVDNANPTTDPDIRYSLKDIKDKYADKTDHLYIYEKKNTISIDNMVVKKEYRNQGIGTAILNDVIDYADRVQKTITLTPTSEFGTKERLKKWYKTNGFVENKGRNTDFTISDTMYRLPSSTSFSLKGGVDVSPQKTTDYLNAVEGVRKGKKGAAERLAKYVDEGMIRTEAYDALIEKYGAIHTGEKPSRDVQVPRKSGKNKKVSQTVRTILEAQVTPDEAVPTIEKMVEDGVFSYEAYSDKAAIANSEKYLQTHGWTESYKDWFDAVDKGEVSKDTTTMGWFLYNNAANRAATTTGEQRQEAIKESLNILEAMVRHQRNAAQALQATRILKKLSPEAQLYGVQKSVQAFQKELTEKYGDKAPNLQIDEELAEKFLTAETEEERLEAEIEIYKDIGRQMPSNWMDKWNAWRYVAMLTNPRTHIRNILGNAFFAPVVATKNLTATAIESMVAPVVRLSGREMLRGKSIVWGNKADRALIKAAWNDYANVADIVSNGGKYNDSAMGNKYIQEGRRIFKGILMPVEWVRRGNSNLLEWEDMWFSKPHYAYALAQYCKANNITAEQIQRGKAIAPAREYAIKEAQKATYKDTNAFSQMVSEIGRNGKRTWATNAKRTLIEGVLPFRKTPANILVRGVEYSPLGFLKGVADLRKVGKKVDGRVFTASEAIDNISAGLTGTGLLALGVYLAAQGLVRGHGEEDKDEKEFKELMGHQNYALELPNGESVTLDWLAPESLPFFTGVAMWEMATGDKKDFTIADVQTALQGISDPMLEMSFLQGLNDALESIGYAKSNDTKAIPTLISTVITSYISQGIPTLFGQIERTGEEERMTTYTEKDGLVNKDTQYALGKASAKIPFWDYNQIPYIDAWGRKEASGSKLKRGLNNFLNPAYTSTIETSSMEEELLRLYEQTGEGSVFPSRAKKSFTVDGEDIYLTGEEYVRYATLKGEKSYELVSDLVNSQAYKKLSDEEKAKAIAEAYDYANQKAKQAISNYKPETWVAKADEFGSNVGNYISFKTEVSGTREANGGKISKQEVVDIVLDMAQNDSETWKMYLSMYDGTNDLYAYNKGINGEDYMYFLEALEDVDTPSKSGKYGTYTQEEARAAVKQLEGLTRAERATLWQSVNTTWKAKNNPWR